jgi:hypothetical protein
MHLSKGPLADNNGSQPCKVASPFCHKKTIEHGDRGIDGGIELIAN